MGHHRLLGWGLVLLVCSPLALAADAPASKLAAEGLPAVKRLMADLASDSYTVREAARVALMGLKRADLPVLREATKDAAPLMPSQLAVLRDIVMQVYLSGDDYEVDEDAPGFLGVSLQSEFSADGSDLGRGVPVLSRMPGFCAYRMLQNGDVLLSMKYGDREPVIFRTTTHLIEAVIQVKGGETINFEVLRQGKIINVPIKLDQRPRRLSTAAQGWLQEFTAGRADAAEKVWEKEFAPLLGNTVG